MKGRPSTGPKGKECLKCACAALSNLASRRHSSRAAPRPAAVEFGASRPPQDDKADKEPISRALLYLFQSQKSVAAIFHSRAKPGATPSQINLSPGSLSLSSAPIKFIISRLSERAREKKRRAWRSRSKSKARILEPAATLELAASTRRLIRAFDSRRTRPSERKARAHVDRALSLAEIARFRWR